MLGTKTREIMKYSILFILFFFALSMILDIGNLSKREINNDAMAMNTEFIVKR